MTDYDEITRLRLRLAEVELQRDAFKAMADKAVTDLIRQVLQKEKPATDWAALGSTYYTYDPNIYDTLSERVDALTRPKKPAKRKRRG